MRLARARRLSEKGGEDHPRLLDRDRSQSTYIPARDWDQAMERRDSSAARARALEQMMAAADDCPIMIICYSRDDATISYVNKEVFRVLGRNIASGKPVESILDEKFLAERSVDSCRLLFGIGEMVENKKSAVELRSAAGNTLPAMLVMRAAANGRDCTATLFPGHAFQADFLEWQTAKTYRSAPPSRAHGPGISISDIGTTANIGQAVKSIFVEMDTLRKVTADDKVEWREFAHWRDGLQQSVASTKDGEMQLGRAHLSTVKFHDFLLLRKLITRGTVMIDLEVPPACTPATALHFIASAIVEDMISSGALDDDNRDEAMQVVQAQHQHATERRKRKLVDELLGSRHSKGNGPSAAAAAASGGGGGGGAVTAGPAAGPPQSESDASTNGAAGAAPPAGAGGGGTLATADGAAEPPALASSGSKVSFAKGTAALKRAGSREQLAAQHAELREPRDEACDVLAGTVSFLDEQAAVFVRLKRAVDLGQITGHEEGAKPPPVRFVFLVLGPAHKERDNQHVAHAIACMMSNRDFASKAQVLASKDDLLETIDGSIDQTNLTFAHNIAAMREREAAEAEMGGWGCCGVGCLWPRGERALTISMDGFGAAAAGKRAGYSAVTIVEVAVSSVPAPSSVYEVKHFERPQHVRRLRRLDVPGACLVLCLAVFAASVLVFWTPAQPRDDVLHARLRTLQAAISSPLYSASRAEPLVLALADDGLEAVVDVRLLAPCLDLDCGAELASPDGRSNTRRARMRTADARRAADRRRLVASTSRRYEGASWVEWALEAGGVTCDSRRLPLAELAQTESLVSVDVRASRCAAQVAAGATFRLRVSTDAPGGLPVMVQAVKMGPIGRARVGLAAALLGLLFAALHFEIMHRVYATIVAATLALGLLSLTSSLPPPAVVVGFIDMGTIMLTFAMSVNVHLLALTGFFEWVSAKAIEWSGGSVRRLFFLLTNMTGVLSALLDNVVVVLLLGPITIKLCEQLGVNPLPLYLTQTLAATLGGTATLLGDPLNVMLGNKLGLSFDDFVVFNAPLMLFVMPAATAVQYYRMRHTLGAERVELDVARLRFENRIYDERSLLFLAAIFVGIFLGLILSLFHDYEGAWFCALGMLGAAVTTSRYDIRHAIGAVEWDVLLFFAALFVFVGALEELGLIRDISLAFSGWINRMPAESQQGVALLVVLWVSAIGSAFLESLAYTMVIAYVLNSMSDEGALDAPVRPLMWALSLGACVGGIGSLKGSSANLACVGVSERFSPSNPIKGEHFLRYGFPLLLVIVGVGSLYQYVVFVHIARGGEGYL